MLASCNTGGSLATYWNGEDVKVTETNYAAAEERFAKFAELLVKASPEEAEGALEALIDMLKEDEVTYFVYSEWFESAFHNYYSPCHNFALFETAVKRMAADGILPREEVERLQRLAAQDRLNQPGDHCTLPDGAEADGAALYLVLDLDCRSCREALAGLAGTHPEAEHIALCFGYSPFPDVPGWRFLKPDGMKEIFELEAAPFWFLTSADGTVRIPYSTEFNAPAFATPEAL